MSPFYQDDDLTLWVGDCRDVLPTLPDCSVDAVCTDPPYELAFMGRAWDKTGVAYDVEVWRQCLRVLRPGGHLLAFGGTRTWHRLTCAVEDAGFEIRDSIAWLYGSGFPKSLDVSKAIDTAGAGQMRRAKLAHFIAERGVGAEWLIEHGVADAKSLADWTVEDHCPSDQNWQKIRDALSVTPEEEAAFERTVTGQGRSSAAEIGFARAEPGLYEVTAPATDAAARWQGWGTALKPGHEPIVVARKPLGGTVSIRARVEHELRARGVEGEIRWTRRPVSDAARRSLTTSSCSTEPPRTVATSAASASAPETLTTAVETDSSTATLADGGGPPTKSKRVNNDEATPADSEQPSLPHTGRPADAAGSTASNSSLSTTSTGAAPRTAGPSTARSTSTSDATDSRPDIGSFAGIATGLTGSQTHVHISRNPDGSYLWPDDLSETVSSGGTVAANVQAWGTGALNIDACRVETNGEPVQSQVAHRTGSFTTPLTDEGPRPREYSDQGRWPANVVLDGEMADALDQQTGTLRSAYPGDPERAAAYAGTECGDGDQTVYAPGLGRASASYADSGGASRFFPTFRYEPKAPASERPRDDDGTSHPTVKPLELMRWLIKLVTPLGGVVLDPFLGSGTTAEACIVEGFRCVGIEKDEASARLVVKRLSKPIGVVLF